MFGVGGLVPLFYTHVAGGGHYPNRLALAGDSEAYFEVGRCRNPQEPRTTTWAYTSLHMQHTPPAGWSPIYDLHRWAPRSAATIWSRR
ncbi:MAG: hypothetical protein HZY76_09585 [Anaerolineae bacterium]|nr:MAG: hypothetical protein HZY76_09585 [Anaerolineae bacterium]